MTIRVYYHGTYGGQEGNMVQGRSTYIQPDQVLKIAVYDQRVLKVRLYLSIGWPYSSSTTLLLNPMHPSFNSPRAHSLTSSLDVNHAESSSFRIVQYSDGGLTTTGGKGGGKATDDILFRS